MTTKEKAQMINCHYEYHGSETRFWQADNGDWFICSNALSDQDDIYPVSEKQIDERYAELFCQTVQES